MTSRTSRSRWGVLLAGTFAAAGLFAFAPAPAVAAAGSSPQTVVGDGSDAAAAKPPPCRPRDCYYV